MNQYVVPNVGGGYYGNSNSPRVNPLRYNSSLGSQPPMNGLGGLPNQMVSGGYGNSPLGGHSGLGYMGSPQPQPTVVPQPQPATPPTMSYQVIQGSDPQGYQVIGGSPAGYQVIGSQPQRNTPQPQPTPPPSYRQRLQNQWNNARQGSEDFGNKVYDWSRKGFGIDPSIERASWNNTGAMKSSFKSAAGSVLDPRGLGGLANYGLAGIGGVMDFSNKVNAGMDFDDAAGQAVGRTAGSIGGGAIGAGLGSAAAVPLAMIPVVGPVLAAAAPFVGGYLGNKWGGNAGDAIGGGIVDIFDQDNDFTRGDSQQKQFDQLSKYAEFLSPDEKQNLANYLALSDAQSQIDQRDALFANDLATQQMRDMAKINFDNDAAMSSLNARIQAELDDRNNRYRMAENNTNNLWNGLANAQNFAARIYGA